jgi:hypothetical protein
MDKLVAFFDFLDRRAVFHRAVLLYALWLVYEVTWNSFNLAWGSARPGVEVAAIIAAIQLPVTTLLGAVLKFYSDYRAGP